MAMNMRARLAVTAAALALVVLPTTNAAAELPHQAPQKAAKVRFGPGFPALVDHEWGFPLGGFGGVTPGALRNHVPVIFVHGNNVDHADWYPVRDDFHAAGWTDQELWALSYNGLGANNGSALFRTNPERDAEHTELGSDGIARITNDDGNVPDLYDFILAVRAYTGSDRFSLVGHSLGVTLARKTLKVHPELRSDLVAFVGIAGANDGTTFCPPGSEGVVVSCNEIALGTPWLAELNGPDGADETYAPARWLTIYDGSGAGDPAFVGPLYAQSPALEGADNRQFPGTYHNDLRINADLVRAYRLFLEDADRPAVAAVAPEAPRAPAAASASAAPAGQLPATGATDLAGPPLVVLALALGLRRLRQASGRS
jgi:pimeloyl-ACP methyl ester carboxylesterase